MGIPSVRPTSGMALIEVLVAVLVLGVSTIAVTGLAVVGTRFSFEAERQTLAQGIVNSAAEAVRGMSYSNVGYVDAEGQEARGTLHRTQGAASGGLQYTLNTDVHLIDDPDNGTLPPGTLSADTADYKRVKLLASWQLASGTQREVSAVLDVQGQQGCFATIPCVPGTPAACPNVTAVDSNCVPFVGTGACIPKTLACPASGFCPVKNPPTTVCPPGASFCGQCASDANCAGGYVCNTQTAQCIAQAGACRTSADCSGGDVCGLSGYCESNCTVSGCTGGDSCNVTTGVCSPACSGDSCECATGTVCGASGLCVTPTPPPSPPPTDPPPTDPPPPTPTPTPTPTLTPTPTVTPDIPCTGDADCAGIGTTCNLGSGVCEPPSPTPDPTSDPSSSPSSSPPPGSPCSGDADCGGGVCSAGTCEESGPAACTADSQCAPGQTCAAGVCDDGTLLDACADDSACSSGQSCIDGACQGSWCGDPDVQCVDNENDPMCSSSVQCTPDPTPTPAGDPPGASTGGGTVPGYSPPPDWCDTDGDGSTNCACGEEISEASMTCTGTLGPAGNCVGGGSDCECHPTSCSDVCPVVGTTCDGNCGSAHDTCVNEAGGSPSILEICQANYAECLDSCDRTTCCANLDHEGCKNNNPNEAPGTGCMLGSEEQGYCTAVTDTGGTSCEYYVCTSEAPSP